MITKHLRISKTLRSLFIYSALVLTACEDEKIKIDVTGHINSSKLYLKRGSFKASLIEIKNAYKAEPNNPEVLSAMAETLLKLSNPVGANEVITRALTLSPKNPELQILLVKINLMQNKILSAESTLNKISDLKTIRSSKYKTLKAKILLSSNSPTEAYHYYSEAHESNPQNIDAIIGLAKASLSLKNLQAVEQFTLLAVKTAPTDIRALLWQAQYYTLKKEHFKAEGALSRAMIEVEKYDTLTADKYAVIEMLSNTLIAQGKIQESLTYSNYLAQSRVGKVHAAYNKAINLVSNNVDLTGAEKAFKDVMLQAPNHMQSGIMLGLINYEKGNLTEADEYLSKFAQNENSPVQSKKILALTKLRLNKPDEAMTLLKEIIKLNKSDADAYALMGQAYLLKDDVNNGIRELSTAISLNNKNSSYHSSLAKAYISNKEFDKAIKSALTAIKITPNSQAPKLNLVRAYMAKNDIKSAKSTTQRWINDEPKNTQALSILATIELSTKNTPAATNHFNSILKIEPNHLLANLYFANTALQAKDTKKSIDILSALLTTHADNVQVLSLLLKSATPMNTEEINKSLQSVVINQPLAINAKLALAQSYLISKKPQQSLQVLNDILKTSNKNLHAYLLIAKIQASLKEFTAANESYKIIVSLFPNLTIGHLEYAKFLFLTGEFKSSSKHFKKVLGLSPANVDAHVGISNVYLRLNEKELLFTELMLLKSKLPESSLPYELEADYYLSIATYSEAIKALNTAWSKQPSINLANKLASAYKKLGKADKSFIAWHEIAKLKPSNPKVQLAYSLALYSDGQFDKAKQSMEAQLKTAPYSAQLNNNLANVYLELNDKRALKTATKALSLSPGNPAIEDTLGLIYHLQLQDYDKAISLFNKAYSATNNAEIKQHLEAVIVERDKKFK